MTAAIFPSTFEGMTMAEVVRVVAAFGGARRDSLSGRKEYKKPIPMEGYESIWLVEYVKTARGYKSPPHALIRMLEEYLQLPPLQTIPPTPGQLAGAMKRRK